MSSNGRLSRRALATVPGGGLLRKDAAVAYRALDRYLRRTTGHSLEHAGDGALYRPIGKPGDYPHGPFTQWHAWERYEHGGNLAARPGTSNHGLGLAADFSGYSIELVKRHGSAFGWRKTEAFGEPWHYCYVPGRYKRVRQYAGVLAGETIRQGDRGSGVVELKRRLRRAGLWPRIYPINAGYGRVTAAAVRKLQERERLTADGVVGARTWKALGVKAW